MYLRKSCKIVFISILVNLMFFTWVFEVSAEVADNRNHWKRGLEYLKEKNYQSAENNFNYYLRNASTRARMAGVAHFGLGLLSGYRSGA